MDHPVIRWPVVSSCLYNRNLLSSFVTHNFIFKTVSANCLVLSCRFCTYSFSRYVSKFRVSSSSSSSSSSSLRQGLFGVDAFLRSFQQAISAFLFQAFCAPFCIGCFSTLCLHGNSCVRVVWKSGCGRLESAVHS